MAKDVAMYYYAHKNEGQAAVAGVPLRDLTQEEWDSLPEHARNTAEKSGLFYKTKPDGWVSQEDKDQAIIEEMVAKGQLHQLSDGTYIHGDSVDKEEAEGLAQERLAVMQASGGSSVGDTGLTAAQTSNEPPIPDGEASGVTTEPSAKKGKAPTAESGQDSA